jgi:hypothetical protein
VRLTQMIIVSLMISHATAFAEDPNEFRAYIDGHGFVNGSFISEPKSKTFPTDTGVYLLPYPGFGGVGGGGGMSLGIGWQAVSLDIGFDWSSDQAEGRIDGFTYTMSQTTQHIPLTLRLEVPNLMVRPSLIAGVDWVSTSNPKLEKPSNYVINPPLLDPKEDSYTAWRFGFGFDFMINDRLRVPFRLIAIYAPIDRSDLTDYIKEETGPTGLTTGFKYRSKWEWQPQVTLGLTYDFHLF